MGAYTRPSPERLREGARHLSYEIRQFYMQWALLNGFAGADPSRELTGIDHFLRSDLFVAVLEAWLVHVRALLMAFRENRRGPRSTADILFRDYLDGAAWDRLRSQLIPTSELEERIDGIGTLLVHASYDRAESRFQQEWKDWGQDEYGAIHVRLRTWKAALAPSRQFFGDTVRLIDSPPGAVNEI